jgi:ADP-ribosylglycohydrolase
VNERRPRAPLPAGYWAEAGRLLAGEYPGHADPALAAQRIAGLLDLGIDYFVDLTWPDELPSYAGVLPSPYTPGPRGPVMYSRRPIRDHGLPREPLQMVEILDELEHALANGQRVFLHCRAGIGRTGTVVGCWLARRTGSGTAALAALDELWRRSGRARAYPSTPETAEQVDYVRRWPELDRPGAPALASTPVPQTPASPPRLSDAVRGPGVAGAAARAIAPSPTPVAPAAEPVADLAPARFKGLVVGLAVGDALGMPLEGCAPAEVPADPELAPGGPHELPAGAWTDDTALALLLVDSLVARGGHDAHDQIRRYAQWQRRGYLSSTGRCVGIGATTARALAQAQWSGNPYSGPHDPGKADKDPLSRAAIAAAWAAADPERAVALAAEVVRTTHQAPLVLDACRLYAALVVGALRGADREALLAPQFEPAPGLWARRPLRPEIAAIAAGAWRKQRTAPTGGGTAADALVLALWALERGETWRAAVTSALSLGRDTPTNGALVGALAGALWGVVAIPPHWRAGVAKGDWLEAAAERLHEAAVAAPAPA